MIRRLAVALLLCAIAGGAAAQEDEEREPDFLFGEPRGYFGIRGGWHAARSSGEVYEFFEELLTIEGSDFDSFTFGLEAGVRVTSRIDVVFGFDFSRATIDSEFREFTDQNDRPIEQGTTLDVVPLTASVKLYFVPAGRAVSSYAYVPTKVRPYVGAGGGAIVYQLKTEGEFVDEEDLSIFADTLISSGTGLGGHVFGGIETQLTARLSLAFEGRYLWADARFGGDFGDSEPIDLTGLRITAALNIAF